MPRVFVLYGWRRAPARVHMRAWCVLQYREQLGRGGGVSVGFVLRGGRRGGGGVHMHSRVLLPYPVHDVGREPVYPRLLLRRRLRTRGAVQRGWNFLP